MCRMLDRLSPVPTLGLLSLHTCVLLPFQEDCATGSLLVSSHAFGWQIGKIFSHRYDTLLQHFLCLL